MGFNSVLVVLNDRLDEIERDPEFGKKVADAIRSHGYPRYQRYVTGQTQVISVHHADTLAVVAVGGNTGRIIGYGHWSQDDESLIQHLERERKRKAKEAKSNGV
jgi:hypothetical protein